MKEQSVKTMLNVRKLMVLPLLILLSGNDIISQSNDPEEILNKVKEAFKIVEDYEVDVHIKIDVEFLKIPETNAKLYFKQPDKIHVESEKFALLPRQGLDFSPIALLDDKYTAIYEGDTTVRSIPTSIVKIIPIGSNSDVILSTLWIDRTRNLILKVESSRKPTGTYSIEFTYNKYFDQYDLPSSMHFSFTVDRMKLPKGMGGRLEPDNGTVSEKSGPVTGNVYLNYSNYIVNQNLSDELFDSFEKEGLK
jgi:outer membrane lipoprotein-sorting protein